MTPSGQQVADAPELGRIRADFGVPIVQPPDRLGAGLVGAARQRSGRRVTQQAVGVEEVGHAVVGARPAPVPTQDIANGLVQALAGVACRNQQRATARSEAFRADSFVHSVPLQRARPRFPFMIPGSPWTHMPRTRSQTGIHAAPDDAVDTLRGTLAEAGIPADRLDTGVEIAACVLDLTQDRALALGALLHAATMGLDALAAADQSGIRGKAGPEAVRLAAQLGKLGEFGLDEHWAEAQALNASQAETLRKMLLAVVGDPRLVVARLAQQLVRIRHARGLPAAVRRRIALETRDLYAPIANRLGIWGVKWELEDLAFRELQPDEYKRLAGTLNEKRQDRESYIARVCAQLADEMRKAGIEASIQGRPKHIYSIYRK
ncbi:MAG: hypothetical protein RLZZ200_2022, partial [Pseudomonadota bacterium]